MVREVRPITANFTYVRWLGDRKGIEEKTKVWNELIVDRRTDLRMGENSREGSQAKNSDFRVREQPLRGFGPATVQMFQDLWRRHVKEQSRLAKQKLCFLCDRHGLDTPRSGSSATVDCQWLMLFQPMLVRTSALVFYVRGASSPDVHLHIPL